LVLAALVGINVYFLGLRGGTSISALLHNAHVRGNTPSISEAVAKPAARIIALPEDPPGSHVVDGVLADGQTVAQALASRLGRPRAESIEKILGQRVDLTALHAGQEYALVYDIDDRLVAFELRQSRVLAFHIDLVHRNNITSLEGRAETRVVGLSLPAGPPLWDALKKAGEGAALGERLAELFAGEGELTGAAVPPGERVWVLVEKRLVGGRVQRYGRVVAAEWSARAGVHRAFFFAGAQPGHYTERGESVERKLRLAPFRALRGTSPSRRDAARTVAHPADPSVAALSVDIAVPAGGSPAVAVAPTEGTLVTFSRTPSGTTLVMQSDGGRVTYANLSRLAPGLRMGQHVQRGQALGRVEVVLGVTCEGLVGLCDGHTQAPRVSSLSATERPRFGEVIAPLIERLRELAIRPHDPLAGRALSAMP
jgi:hypothetical protein